MHAKLMADMQPINMKNIIIKLKNFTGFLNFAFGRGAAKSVLWRDHKNNITEKIVNAYIVCIRSNAMSHQSVSGTLKTSVIYKALKKLTKIQKNVQNNNEKKKYPASNLS